MIFCTSFLTAEIERQTNKQCSLNAIQEEEALFIERYFEGKKLLNEGMYKESLNSLKYAHKELIIQRDNFIYYKLYINCTITLALALDYLGVHDEIN